TICEQKKIPFVFIPAKLDLGKAVGLSVPCAAASIEKAGEGQAQMKEAASWAAGKTGAAKQEKPEKQEAPTKAAATGAAKQEAPTKAAATGAAKQEAPKK